MKNTSPDRAHQAGTILGLLTLLGALLTCVLPAVPPGQDAPPHIAAAAVLANPERFSAWFETTGAPTGYAFEAVVAPLSRVLPLLVAAKFVLAVFTLLLAFGTARAAQTLGGDKNVGLALGAAYAVGWTWAMGFYNFIAALAVAVWAIPFLFRANPSWKQRGFGALVLLLAAWAHIITTGMFLVQLLALRWATGGLGTDRKRMTTLGRDALTALPALAYSAYWFANALGGETGAQGRGHQVATTFGSVPETIADILSTSFGAFTPLGWLGVAAVLGALAVGMIQRERRVAILALCWLGFMAALPLHGLGWHFARPRVGYFAFVLTIAALPYFSRYRWMPAIVASAAAIVVWAGVPGAIVESERGTAALSAFGERVSGRTLEVVFHAEPRVASGPYMRTAIGLPHYATLNGGAAPGAFATSPVAHPIRFRGGMDAVFPPGRLTYDIPAACMATASCYHSDQWQADRLAQAGLGWDTVALVNAPVNVAMALWARGWDGQSGANAFGEVSGLYAVPSAELSIAIPDGERGTIEWVAGFPDTIGAIEQGSAALTEDGSVLRITPLPVGDVTVEVRFNGRPIAGGVMSLAAGENVIDWPDTPSH